MEPGLNNKTKGFTLLEVMMALIIISVGLVALVHSSRHSANTLEVAKNKTAALHVADQVMLQLYERGGLQLGVHQGEQRFQGQLYYWQATLTTTDNNRINRLEVKVGLNRDFKYAEAQLSGFKKS
jgi:general secretion pathway protein I